MLALLTEIVLPRMLSLASSLLVRIYSQYGKALPHLGKVAQQYGDAHFRFWKVVRQSA